MVFLPQMHSLRLKQENIRQLQREGVTGGDVVKRSKSRKARGPKNHNSARKQFSWPTECSGALPGWILNQTRAFVGETVSKEIGIVSELTTSSDHSTVVVSDDNIRGSW